MKTRRLYLLFTFLIISMFSFGQTSTGNGEWSAVGLGGYNVALGATKNVYHIVTSANNINVLLGGNLIIGDNIGTVDSLIITAQLLSALGSNIVINTGGVLFLDGNLSNTLVGSITVYGTLKVTGNVNNAFSTVTVASGGYIGVAGNFTNTGGTVSNSGEILVGGTYTGSYTGTAPNDAVTPGEALPIELNYFQAYKSKTNVILNWQTATEKNNDYFTIERSTDGVNYEIIGTVQGAGNSITAINYSYTDNYPINGISYYRLMQTDYDGAFEIFSPISVSYFNESDLKVGPIPASDQINISVGGEMGAGNIKLYNITGALVKTVDLNSNHTQLNVSDLPKGNYMMVISDGATNITKKIMIQ